MWWGSCVAGDDERAKVFIVSGRLTVTTLRFSGGIVRIEGLAGSPVSFPFDRELVVVVVELEEGVDLFLCGVEEVEVATQEGMTKEPAADVVFNCCCCCCCDCIIFSCEAGMKATTGPFGVTWITGWYPAGSVGLPVRENGEEDEEVVVGVEEEDERWVCGAELPVSFCTEATVADGITEVVGIISLCCLETCLVGVACVSVGVARVM